MAVIAVVALTVRVGLIDLPTLIAFIAILYRLQPRIRALITSRVTLLGLQGAVLTVTDFPDAPPDPARGSGRRTFSGLKREIRFEHVTFRYDEAQRPALDHAALTIRRGGMTAVVGRSGAGKSTLLDLLLQFQQPQQGMILVDGIPLETLDIASWRSRIAVVSQDPYIFDDSVRDNILYGRPTATDAEIAAAACLAHADHFIAELPRGYETIVGDRGVRLSGGQRQRLALARALARRPDILVLDEATNALDSLTEQAFQEALLEFARERTVIVVAHRLSTIERADHIVFLDSGRVVEQATFADLLRADGLFARMHRLQSLGRATADSPAGGIGADRSVVSDAGGAWAGGRIAGLGGVREIAGTGT